MFKIFVKLFLMISAHSVYAAAPPPPPAGIDVNNFFGRDVGSLVKMLVQKYLELQSNPDALITLLQPSDPKRCRGFQTQAAADLQFNYLRYCKPTSPSEITIANLQKERMITQIGVASGRIVDRLHGVIQRLGGHIETLYHIYDETHAEIINMQASIEELRRLGGSVDPLIRDTEILIRQATDKLADLRRSLLEVQSIRERMEGVLAAMRAQAAEYQREIAVLG